MDIKRLTPYRSCSPGLCNFGSGVTHQEFRDLCDINAILRRYRATGVLPQCQGMVSMPCDSFLYGDFTTVQNTIKEVENVNDLATSVVLPFEGTSQDSSDSLQEEGGVKTVVGDGVKGEAQANPGA